MTRKCRSWPTVEEEMLRVLLYVALLAGLFAGAVLWVGNAVGAFEPMTVPAHAPGVSSSEPTKGEKPHKKQHKEAKKH